MNTIKLCIRAVLNGILYSALILNLAVWDSFANAQTASILPQGSTQFFDNNGNPLSAGTVDFYTPGTTTRKTTWQNSGETVTNTNPVVLDSAGRALIWGDGAYRMVVKDASGNLIYDQITSSAAGGGGGSTTVGDGNLVGTVLPWSGLTAPNQYQFAYGQEVSRATFAQLMTAITTTQAVFCTSGSTTVTGLSDTSQISIGAHIEASCLPSGTTVASRATTTITVSNAATSSANTNAIIFPWGNGNGSTTFNLPDLRGVVLAGRDNMGNIAANKLTTAYFGNADALGVTGGNQSHTLTTSEAAPITITSATTTTVDSLSVGIGIGSGTGSPGSGPAAPGATRAGTFSSDSVTPTAHSTTTSTTNAGGQPHSIVQPTTTINYIIKTTPDSSSSVASGVASLGGMQGVIACGTGLLCTGNIISLAGGSIIPPPTVGTLGGVFLSSGATHQFAKGVDATGALLYAQPDFTDISGTISNSQFTANQITASIFRQSGALSVVGNATNATANVADISAVAGSDCAFREFSSALGCGQLLTGAYGSNSVSNAKLVQAAGATLKGNPTVAGSNVTDFTIQGLTARGAPDAANDKLLIYDNAAGTLKYVTPAQVASAATSGVSSLGGLTGALLLGTGLTSSGSTILVDSTVIPELPNQNIFANKNAFRAGLSFGTGVAQPALPNLYGYSTTNPLLVSLNRNQTLGRFDDIGDLQWFGQNATGSNLQWSGIYSGPSFCRGLSSIAGFPCATSVATSGSEEGSIYITRTNGSNFITIPTNAATASGATLHFASSIQDSGNLVGAVVTDVTTPGAIAANTRVAQQTATTIILTTNVITTVGSADTIKFSQMDTDWFNSTGLTIAGPRNLVMPAGYGITSFDTSGSLTYIISYNSHANNRIDIQSCNGIGLTCSALGAAAGVAITTGALGIGVADFKVSNDGTIAINALGGSGAAGSRTVCLDSSNRVFAVAGACP